VNFVEDDVFEDSYFEVTSITSTFNEVLEITLQDDFNTLVVPITFSACESAFREVRTIEPFDFIFSFGEDLIRQPLNSIYAELGHTSVFCPLTFPYGNSAVNLSSESNILGGLNIKLSESVTLVTSAVKSESYL